MTTLNMLTKLQRQLRNGLTVEKTAFIGFDGFIDKVVKPVKTKSNYSTTFYDTIDEFIAKIEQSKGSSGQIELKPVRVKIGGNAPIFANALGRLGVRSCCIGACGYPVLDDLFESVNRNCELITVLNPGVSQALEFKGSKLILSELDIFDNYNWSYIKTHSDLDKIRMAVSSAGICAFLDWANLPHSSDIWYGVLNDIIRATGRKDYLFLFDLCDPWKKTKQEINELLELISSFSSYGKVTLGVNENETLRVWSAITDKLDNGTTPYRPDVVEAAQFLYKFMNIEWLLVHTIDQCLLIHKKGKVQMEGHLVTQPKVLTGAGDNLNAGFTLALLTGMTQEQCVLLGMAASGAYIANGFSPSIPDLIAFIEEWKSAIEIAVE